MPIRQAAEKECPPERGLAHADAQANHGGLFNGRGPGMAHGLLHDAYSQNRESESLAAPIRGKSRRWICFKSTFVRDVLPEPAAKLFFLHGTNFALAKRYTRLRTCPETVARESKPVLK
ncbi:hypothetical protein [Noviherbaspirillum agri]